MRLTDHLQRSAVRHAPQVIRPGGQVFIASELHGLPFCIVGGFRKAASLAKTIQHLAMGRPLGEPGRLQAPERRERGVVEHQLLAAIEHGDRLGNVVQGFVVRLHVSLKQLAQLFLIGDVLGPDADASSFQGLSRDQEGAPLARDGRPTHGVATLAQIGGFAGQGVGAAVEAGPPGVGLV